MCGWKTQTLLGSSLCYSEICLYATVESKIVGLSCISKGFTFGSKSQQCLVFHSAIPNHYQDHTQAGKLVLFTIPGPPGLIINFAISQYFFLHYTCVALVILYRISFYNGGETNNSVAPFCCAYELLGNG